MKKRILLLDESLTVQKVVALTLDRERYSLTNAKSRSEAMKVVLDSPPDLILVSDQVSGLSASAFPKEVETWVGRDRKLPTLILVTNQAMRDQRGFQAVLKKPFTPQALQSAVSDTLGTDDGQRGSVEEGEETRLSKMFNDTFSDEAELVNETFRAEQTSQAESTLLTIPAPQTQGPARPAKKAPTKENGTELWGHSTDTFEESGGSVQVLGPEDSMAYKAQLEAAVRSELDSHDLEDIVHRLLEKIVPPIVERLTQARLDQLLKESENFVELKP